MNRDIRDAEYIARIWRMNDERLRQNMIDESTYYLAYYPNFRGRDKVYFLSRNGDYITTRRENAYRFRSEDEIDDGACLCGKYLVEKVVPEITVEHRQVEINPALIDPEFLMTVKGDAES